jgi:hypothetical protein
MKRVILEKFDFIHFTGIGFISTRINTKHIPLQSCSSLMFQFCFPLMVEKWYSNISGTILLKPQAKFEVSRGRIRWVETYYQANFVFKKEHETIYNKWRSRFFSEKSLSFLEDYDEASAFVYFTTVLDQKENGEEDYLLVHDFKENFYVLPKHKNENLYVLSKTYAEKDIIDRIDEAVDLEIFNLLKNRHQARGKRRYRASKVLHLNEKFQEVFDEKLSNFKKKLALN